MAELSLRDRMRSMDIWKELRDVEMTQLGWFGHLLTIPPGGFTLEVFWVHPFERRPLGRPGIIYLIKPGNTLVLPSRKW